MVYNKRTTKATLFSYLVVMKMLLLLSFCCLALLSYIILSLARLAPCYIWQRFADARYRCEQSCGCR